MDDTREVDKSGWGEGPWQDEADDGQWVDPATGLDCMIHRNHGGALCGYVGVGREHPLYGKSYQEVDDIFSVHGGLTYSRECQEGGIICHVPEPGRSGDIWWFGFDTAHFMDYAPGMEAELAKFRKVENIPKLDVPELDNLFKKGPEGYKNWAYVTAECELLAKQLVEAA